MLIYELSSVLLKDEWAVDWIKQGCKKAVRKEKHGSVRQRDEIRCKIPTSVEQTHYRIHWILGETGSHDDVKQPPGTWQRLQLQCRDSSARSRDGVAGWFGMGSTKSQVKTWESGATPNAYTYKIILQPEKLQQRYMEEPGVRNQARARRLWLNRKKKKPPGKACQYSRCQECERLSSQETKMIPRINNTVLRKFVAERWNGNDWEIPTPRKIWEQAATTKHTWSKNHVETVHGTKEKVGKGGWFYMVENAKKVELQWDIGTLYKT